MGADKGQGLVALAVGEVLARPARLQGVDEEVALLRAVRIEIAGRMADAAAADVDVVALLVGVPGSGAEVPFADVAGDVARCVQRFGDSHFVEVQVDVVSRAEQPAPSRGDVARLPGAVGREFVQKRFVDVIGQSEPRRIAPRLNRRPGRRTDGAGGVAVGEAHSLPGQPVDVRRLVILAPLARQILPAEIVDEDDDQIGWAIIGRRPLGPDSSRPKRRVENHQGDDHRRAEIHFN